MQVAGNMVTVHTYITLGTMNLEFNGFLDYSTGEGEGEAMIIA